jgi:hypothetical protein
MLRRVLAPLSLGIVLACGSGSDGSAFDEGKKADPATQPDQPGGIKGNDPPPAARTTCGKIDLLFVIDDSASMDQEQVSLANAFPGFIDAIAAVKDGTLDYRVAITTTSSSMVCEEAVDAVGPENSVAVDGALVNTCDMQKPWLSRGEGNVKESFACAAQVGTQGSSDEMPLRTMRAALEQAQAGGQFLREDALLAIVMLTDEDDVSTRELHYTTIAEKHDDLTDVASYGTFLDGLKKHHDRWAAAVIAGDGDCESDFGKAKNAPRLASFAGLAGKHGKVSSICAGDLSVSLRDVLATVQAACNDFPSDVK